MQITQDESIALQDIKVDLTYCGKPTYVCPEVLKQSDFIHIIHI